MEEPGIVARHESQEIGTVLFQSVLHDRSGALEDVMPMSSEKGPPLLFEKGPPCAATRRVARTSALDVVLRRGGGAADGDPGCQGAGRHRRSGARVCVANTSGTETAPPCTLGKIWVRTANSRRV
jgi:hypothetical protein